MNLKKLEREKKLIIKIFLFILFPFFYLFVGILNRKNKLEQILISISLFFIVLNFIPRETSDIHNIEKLYNSLRNMSVIEVVQAKIDFLLPLFLYTIDKLVLPFRTVYFLVFVYYFIILKIFNNLFGKSTNINTLFFVNAVTFWSINYIMENPRFPLANAFFTLGVIEINKKNKKGYILLLISIFIHIGFLPLVFIACLAKINFVFLYRGLYLLSILCIILKNNLIFSIINFLKIFIKNQYLLERINIYFYNYHRINDTTIIIYFLILYIIYYIVFNFNLIISKKNFYLKNVFMLSITFANIFYFYKTVFYRYISGIILLGIIYLIFEREKYLKNINKIFLFIIYIYTIILNVRMLFFSLNYNWYKYLF